MDCCCDHSVNNSNLSVIQQTMAIIMIAIKNIDKQKTFVTVHISTKWVFKGSRDPGDAPFKKNFQVVSSRFGVIAWVHPVHVIMQNSNRWLPTFGPSRQTSGTGPPVDGYENIHPPLPFIITQPESRYSCYHPTEGRRLSRPKWLVTHPDGLPARKQSPIQLVMGPSVD